jgi:hypothetical protein
MDINDKDSKPAVSGKMPDQLPARPKLEELPKSYGDTKIVLLPRDPSWAYTYWEIADSTKTDLRNKHGDTLFSSGQLTLRVYDITDVVFTGKNAHNFFDITVTEYSENWYINMPEVNRSWIVDLGIKLANGEFIVIARSNAINMPHHGISPITDAQWAIVQKEFERLVKLSGGDKIGTGSFDVAKLMKERWEELMSVSSAAMPFSRSVSSFQPQEEFPVEEKHKDFWLKANTELIVYGSTERNAKLTLQGKPLKLNPDGTFSVRFALEDGLIEIPIKAVSADDTMSKEIEFDVTRKTK